MTELGLSELAKAKASLSSLKENYRWCIRNSDVS